MKTTKYETSAGALAAFLASKPQSAAVCDLYTFNLVGGLNGAAPLLYATADVDVLVPYSPTPVTYSSKLLYIDQLSNKAYGHWKVGLDTDTWHVIASPSPQCTIGGQPFLAALNAGILRGATVTVDRAYFDNRASGLPQGTRSISPLGVVNIFTGRVSECDIGRTNAVIALNDHRYLLGVNMPRNLFQATCPWTLYGAGCNLAAASFAVSGTISGNQAALTNPIAVTLAAPGGSGTYALGRIVMTSGANSGFSRSIRSWAPGSPASLQLMAPFAFPLASGDTFTAYPGCDKTLPNCDAFNNQINFGGTPFTPAPETAT